MTQCAIFPLFDLVPSGNVIMFLPLLIIFPACLMLDIAFSLFDDGKYKLAIVDSLHNNKKIDFSMFLI